jgi:small GTP-binding protein
MTTPEIEVRIGVIGNADSGKSTLIGVLTKNVLDDGRGSARALVMRHPHERETGRTSCVTQNYTRAVDPDGTRRNTTFIDLAGQEKYLKTTVSGIHRCYVDYAIVVIGANMGVTRMTEEHLTISLNLAIPTFIVVTKIDMAPPHVRENTLREINNTLTRIAGSARKPIPIANTDDLTAFNKEYYLATPPNQITPVPVFLVSSVHGVGLDLLRSFINTLPHYTSYTNANQEDPHFIIESTYNIKGIGLVVSGFLKSGTVRKGDHLNIGPINHDFIQVTIKTIHNNFREFIDELRAGNSGCFALKPVNNKTELIRRHIRHGTRVVKTPMAYDTFEAKVKILHHPTTIKIKYEPTIHCGSICQSAQIVSMDRDFIRLGDVAHVTFKFLYRPEFIEANSKLTFREGNTRGVGKVIKVCPESCYQIKTAS